MSTITPASGASTSTQLAGAERADQPACALVAFEAHRRVEQASPEKHRVAPPAPACRRCRKRVLVRQEAVDDGVDQPRLDPGHVAEEDKRARDIGRHGGKPDPQRRREAARKLRIVSPLDVKAGERSLDRRARMAGHHDYRTSLRRERCFRRHPHDGLVAELRDKLGRAPTARGAKARRLARGKHDGADPSHRARAAAGASRSPSGARRPPSRGCPRRGSASRPAPAAGPSRSRSLSATGRNPARQ